MINFTFSHWLLWLVIIILSACQSSENEKIPDNFQGEKITRLSHEFKYRLPPPKQAEAAIYPWEETSAGGYMKVSKEFFRCKGNSANAVKILLQGDQSIPRYDCGGSDAHSLPIRDGKEFIYPILIDLLNDLQEQTKKKVIITSGHRCPDHNLYIDDTKSNIYSKHQLGAEVSFYVKGMEDKPEDIIELLQKYFLHTSAYHGLKEYQEFQRWEKGTDVATSPWYNQEVFLKIYKKNEGRNLDNTHPYPYISIQVRYDRETKEKVVYSWDKAFRCFMRW